MVKRAEGSPNKAAVASVFLRMLEIMNPCPAYILAYFLGALSLKYLPLKVVFILSNHLDFYVEMQQNTENFPVMYHILRFVVLIFGKLSLG